MAGDPLDDLLRLVSEGRLTADEAAPILAALDDRAGPGPGAGPSPGAVPGTGWTPGPDAAPGPSFAAGTGGDDAIGGAASTLRIEIREGGRQVVNLRLPIAVGRFALDRIPGLSGDQVASVREALGSGLRGSILAVDDDDTTVRILVE